MHFDTFTMKLAYIGLAGVVATALYVWAARPDDQLPDNWDLAGNMPRSYSIALDRHVTQTGRGSGTLRYENGPVSGYGTLMTSFRPKDYLGKRVRLRAWLKFEDVTDATGLWMRVDTANEGTVALYDSADLHLKGSRDWQPYTVVLDIPTSSAVLSYGVLLSGKGQVWMERMSLDVVGKDVPVSVEPRDEPPLYLTPSLL